VITRSPAETRALGVALANVLEPGDVVLLAGELGTGKTELAKGIGAGLGVKEPIVSPTFTIAREYEGRLALVHADLYRLERGEEVLDLGLEERDDGVTVVEWGDAAASLIGHGDYLEVRLERGDQDDERVITLEPVGASWRARAVELT
jgi:tRNA threonylcarbamoyladenosine biosynthesis protein TsaE